VAKTPNLGLSKAAGIKVTTQAGTQANGDFDQVHALSHDANMIILDAAVGAIGGSQVLSADGAINITQGTVYVTKTSAAAITLALPKAGLPAAGGNDGNRLLVIFVTAHAHVVTTPSNGINGNKLHATSANTEDVIELSAQGGVWYAFNNTATLS
jgi:hypothetical protein